MPHFKDENNELYWLEDDADPSVYLPHCVQITEEETAIIRAAQIQAAIDAMPYTEKRAAEYPSFADQLDLLYHGGIDAWKSVIQAVKDKYPKV